MRIFNIFPLFLLLVLMGCEGKTPHSDGARKLGEASKKTVDKVANEANKAIEQGEARTREAIDGSK